MTLAFIILSIAVVYFSIALATFEKFIENKLVPKSPVPAFLLTPIIIVLFYIKLAVKAPSPRTAFECLKLATIRFPIGIGLFIEGIYLRSEFELVTNTQQQKSTSDKGIKAAVIINKPSIRIWTESLAHA